MSRILLVDDEPLTTRTLQALIQDEMPEVEVYSVNSAVQAMELLKKNLYDVVVTDVAMPRVSGLDLLDQVKALWPMSYVIVLTAYSSFDYAYHAAQYEDVRFILKIEPPEVILEAVRTGLNKVARYFSVSENDQRIQKYMKETLPLLQQTLLERLLLFGEDLPEPALCAGCGISIMPGRDTWLAVTGVIDRQEKKQEICFLVMSMLRDRGFRADAWYAESNGILLVQYDGDADLTAVIHSQLDRIIEETDPAMNPYFVLSPSPVPWDRIGEAALALTLFSRKELEGSRIVLTDPLGDQERRLTFTDGLRWRRSIDRRDLEGLMDSLRLGVQMEGYPEGRERCAVMLQMQLRDSFGAASLEHAKADKHAAESVLFHVSYETAEDWLAAVRALLVGLFSGSSEERLTETEAMLNRINRYIQEHYAEEISLTQIAEDFNYNSSYLSRIYKQAMREGINEHIIRTRIETACRLLKGSEMSVSDIAAQCGFQTTKYFITVFKRLKGKTPKVWREAREQV